MALRLAILFAALALGVVLWPRGAASHHNVYLPYAGQTWLAQQIKATQEQVWCTDSRAEFYPGFVAQLRDVNDHHVGRHGRPL